MYPTPKHGRLNKGSGMSKELHQILINEIRENRAEIKKLHEKLSYLNVRIVSITIVLILGGQYIPRLLRLF